MADLQGRKIFKVFNQDFIVDERYTVTKELGQGAYGIVWYIPPRLSHRSMACTDRSSLASPARPLTIRPTRVSRSRRSPMFLARRFWPSAPYARSSCCNTSGDTAT